MPEVVAREAFIDPNTRCGRCGDRYAEHSFLDTDKQKKYRTCHRLGCNKCLNFVKPK